MKKITINHRSVFLHRLQKPEQLPLFSRVQCSGEQALRAATPQCPSPVFGEGIESANQEQTPPEGIPVPATQATCRAVEQWVHQHKELLLFQQPVMLSLLVRR